MNSDQTKKQQKIQKTKEHPAQLGRGVYPPKPCEGGPPRHKILAMLEFSVFGNLYLVFWESQNLEQQTARILSQTTNYTHKLQII
jgi:hypothetical protein